MTGALLFFWVLQMLYDAARGRTLNVLSGRLTATLFAAATAALGFEFIDDLDERPIAGANVVRHQLVLTNFMHLHCEEIVTPHVLTPYTRRA
ncbi:MAG: hypothetical protein ACOCZH_02455 [Phototrophicaceae bacterium]